MKTPLVESRLRNCCGFSSSSRPGDPEIVDVPLPEIHEEIVEVIQLIPRERLSECTVEQVVETGRGCAISQIIAEIVGLVKTSAC